MVNASELDSITLQVILDRVAAQRTKSGLEGIGVAGKAIGDQTESGTRKASRAMADLERQSKSLRDQVGASGDASGNIAKLSNLARLGGADLGVAADLFDAAEALPLLKENLKGIPSALSAMALALGPVGIVATIAGVALVAVLGDLHRQFEENRAAALTDIELQARLQLLREQGSAQDIETQIKAAQERFDAAHAQVAIAEDLVEGFINGFATEAQRQIARDAIQKRIANGVDFTTALPAQVVGAIDALRGAGPAAKSALIELTGLQNTLKSSEVQTRSLADAETELNDIRAAAANTLNQGLLQATLEAGNLTAKQLEERIKAIANERTVLNEFIATGKFTGMALEDANRRFRQLGEEMGIFLSAVEPARARDRIQAQVDTDAELIELASKYEKDRVAIEGATADKLLALQDQYADRVTDTVNRYVEDTGRALETLTSRSGDLAANAERETNDELRDARFERKQDEIAFAEESAANARTLQRRIEQIKADSADRERDAIRNRDFSTLGDIRTQRNRELKQEVDAFNDSEKERSVQFKNEKQAENRRLEFQAEVRQQAFAREIADLQAQYEREITLAGQQRDKQLKQLDATLQKQTKLEQDASNKKLNILAATASAAARLEASGAEARLAVQNEFNKRMLQQAYDLIRLMPSGGTTNNTLTNTSTYNISAGGGPAQQQGLAQMIASIVDQRLGNFFN